MKKITKIAGEVGTKLRDRSRSVKLRMLDIARAARAKGPQSQERLKRTYGNLLTSTSRVVGQAKRFAKEVAAGIKRSSEIMAQLVLEGLRQELDEMVPRVQQVMKQARARIYRGDTHAEGKIVSLFEPSTEVIRKGKAAKPNEFGKMIKLQEAENQIVIDYEVYDRRPNDSAPADSGSRNASSKVLTHAVPCGGGRGLLLWQERGGRQSQGRQARLYSQSLHQKPRT